MFPPSNPLSKIFNRHTVKVSYTCLPNIGKIISGHNKKNLTKEPPVENLCNYRVQNSCPVANKCLLKNVIYQAIVKRQDNQKVESYIGLTSTSFKERWSTHKSSFKLQSHANDTKLSAYIWKLKREGVNFDLSWKIVSKSNAYNPSSKKCCLCLNEKYFIIYKSEMATLNKRHEFFTPCPHKKKYKLCNHKLNN